LTLSLQYVFKKIQTFLKGFRSFLD